MAIIDFEIVCTNIPLEKNYWKKIIKDLFFATDKVYNFERIKLKQLVTLATYKSFFNFDGEY